MGILPDGWSIELDPPGDWTGDNDESLNNAADRWGGDGPAPSREVAIRWLERQGASEAQARRVVGTSGSLTTVGSRAREYKALLEEEDRLDVRKDTPSRAEDRAKAEADAAARDKPEDAAANDANGDGTVTLDELDANGDNVLGEDELLAAIEGGVVGDLKDKRGAPLWPYAGDGTALEGLTVKDSSKSVPTSQQRNDPREDNPRNANFGGQIGARYYERDALQPMRWSPERVAELQRTMQEIGLYGDKKIRLGTWTAADQDALAAVMSDSNVNGLTWQETLVRWKREPPADLIESIRGEQPSQPTIRVTNPLDIRQASEAVSQSLTGAVDRQFAQGMVGGYQGAEIGAQQAVITDQDMGGGGVEADAPSVQAYAENQLRLQKPLEVDGYQFMSQFETFLDMLGAR